MAYHYIRIQDDTLTMFALEYLRVYSTISEALNEYDGPEEFFQSKKGERILTNPLVAPTLIVMLELSRDDEKLFSYTIHKAVEQLLSMKLSQGELIELKMKFEGENSSLKEQAQELSTMVIQTIERVASLISLKLEEARRP